MLSQDEVDIVVGVLKVGRTEAGKEGVKEGRRKEGKKCRLLFPTRQEAPTHMFPPFLPPSIPPSLPPSIHPLQIASKTVQDCLVPMDKAFCLSTRDELDGPMLVRRRRPGRAREGGRVGRRE